MAPVGKKVSKPIFKTDIPFSETKWPEISSKDQDIILDLLCNLLEPISHHRLTHITASKGRKRKRTSAKSTTIDDTSEHVDTTPLPAPEIANHILVGLNSVTRHLSELAAKTAPKALAASQKPNDPEELMSHESNHVEIRKRTEEKSLRPVSIIILPHPHPTSSLPHAHLPTLVYLSSTKTDTPTRLVTLQVKAESRLAEALQIPRVGAIGILEGTPGANALIDYVRTNVDPVQCKWIEEGLKAEWKGVKTSVQMT